MATFISRSNETDLLGRIPYDTVVTEAMVHGQPVTDYADGTVTEALEEM